MTLYETGTVKWFDGTPEKRFGFIVADVDCVEHFFHYNDFDQELADMLLDDDKSIPKKGDRIEFVRKQGKRGPKAAYWRFISKKVDEGRMTLPTYKRSNVAVGESRFTVLEFPNEVPEEKVVAKIAAAEKLRPVSREEFHACIAHTGVLAFAPDGELIAWGNTSHSEEGAHFPGYPSFDVNTQQIGISQHWVRRFSSSRLLLKAA